MGTNMVKLDEAAALLDVQWFVPDTGRVPIGTVLSYYGDHQQLPENYLFCEGDTIAKTGFPELYAHLVLANPNLRVDEERCRLPDLRGQFLRGWDEKGLVDPGRTLGGYQPDGLKLHSHAIQGIGISSWNGGWGTVTSVHPVVSPGVHQTADHGDANESRPKNICVSFIIRARP